MDGAWHRLGVLFDFALVIAVGAVFFCVLALIVHLVLGGDTSPHGVLASGLRLFAVVWTIALVVFLVGRWVYWFADRWI